MHIPQFLKSMTIPKIILPLFPVVAVLLMSRLNICLDAGYSAIAIYSIEYYANQTRDAPIRMIVNDVSLQCF